MKHLKVTSVLLSAVMCLTMTTTPVVADETESPSETQATEVSEEKADEEPEKSEEKEPEAVEEPDEPEEVAENEAKDAYIAKGKCGKTVKWTMDKKGTLKITGKGAMYNYMANESNFTVNTPWFKHMSKIKKVIISKGVTSVGAYSFFQCTNISSVSLPKTLKSIGACAFCNCILLTKVSIPKKVRKIGAGAFEYCHKLTSVNIPYGVTNIEPYTFEECAFKSIVIPKSVKVIGQGAFECCESLVGITIPASVKTIGVSAFYGCVELKTVNIPLIGAVTIGKEAFSNCMSLTKFNVPLTVTTLEKAAFHNCGVEEISISQKLYSESVNAFSGWTAVSRINYYKWADPGEEFFGGVFKFVVTNPDINGRGTVSVIEMSDREEKIVIPNTVVYKEQTYKVSRIEPCRYVIAKLKYLVLGSNVTSIADKALSGCPELVSVTGGTGLKTIGTRAFEKCPKLKVFSISSKTLSKIGPFAFSGDTALKTVQVKKTTKLTKSGVKKSLAGSAVKTVKVKKSKVKKYKKIFKKKNCGKKVKVKK